MKIKNFTPLFDQLTQITDVFTAAVYGRIWRYEQGRYKKCSAAVKTIAKELGISEKTVERRIKVLEEMELIEDQTPDRRNAPHDYVTSGLVDLVLDGTSESLTGKSESLTQTPRESVEDTKKKQVKKQVKKNGAKPRTPKPKKIPDPLLKHPAIIAYREEARLNVPANWRGEMAETVTNSPKEVLIWKLLVRDWMGFGYNKQNIKGMLDAFKKGGIGRDNRKPTRQSTEDRVNELMEQVGDGK